MSASARNQDKSAGADERSGARAPLPPSGSGARLAAPIPARPCMCGGTASSRGAPLAPRCHGGKRRPAPRVETAGQASCRLPGQAGAAAGSRRTARQEIFRRCAESRRNRGRGRTRRRPARDRGGERLVPAPRPRRKNGLRRKGLAGRSATRSCSGPAGGSVRGRRDPGMILPIGTRERCAVTSPLRRAPWSVNWRSPPDALGNGARTLGRYRRAVTCSARSRSTPPSR